MLAHSVRMYRITVGEHPLFTVPALDFRGIPVGIDVDKVVSTRIQPILNTGIAGRRPGVGQVGAGIAAAPLGCFEDAQTRLAQRLVAR